jgi:hypothetical protein
MLTRVFVAAALAAALMVGVKDGRLLDRAGLTGTCTSVAAPRGDTMAWEACRPGKLEGYPDLTRRSCTAERRVARIEYWRCPARVAGTRGSA